MNNLIVTLIGFFVLPTPAIATTTPVIVDIKPVAETLPPILEKIAWCESRNIATAKNPHSTASGRFQFLNGSWNYYGKKLWGDDLIKKDKLNYQDSTELALYVYKLNGTKDWLASVKCWGSVKDI